MSYSKTFNCNVCGKQKGEANHWLLAVVIKFVDHPDVLTFMHWNDEDAKNPAVIHLCGDECAHKELSKYLGGRNGNSKQTTSGSSN